MIINFQEETYEFSQFPAYWEKNPKSLNKMSEIWTKELKNTHLLRWIDSIIYSLPETTVTEKDDNWTTYRLSYDNAYRSDSFIGYVLRILVFRDSTTPSKYAAYFSISDLEPNSDRKYDVLEYRNDSYKSINVARFTPGNWLQDLCNYISDIWKINETHIRQYNEWVDSVSNQLIEQNSL